MCTYKNTRFALSAIILFSLLLVSFGAIAEPTSLEDVFGATPPGDASMKVFGYIIDQHLSNPFTALGPPNTLFGKLFLTLNAFVFLVGVIFASYGIGAGIVQTAHEGQVLGRRMSAIWMPIRMVTGIAGLIPFFGGFSLAQAVMMLSALLGIGLANYGWKQVLDNFDSFSGMVRPSIGEGVQSKSALGLAYGVFSSELCRVAYEDMISGNAVDDSEKLYGHSKGTGMLSIQAVTGYGKRTSGDLTDDFCGRMEVSSTKPNLDTNTHRGTVSFGFTVGSVNYSGISTAIKNGMFSATSSLATGVAPLASTWYTGWKAARKNGTPVPALPTTAIEAAAVTFSTTLGEHGKGAVPGEGAVSAAAKEQMGRYGWFGAGAWFSTLAEGQTAITDAFKSVEYNLVDPTELMVEGKVSYPDMVADPMAAYLKLLQERASTGGRVTDSFAQAWSSASKWGTGMPTGNESVGQSLVREMIESVGSGSGGGTDFNPIIMLKNTGDYVMAAVQAVYFGGALMDYVPAVRSAKMVGAVKGLLSKSGEKLKLGASESAADNNPWDLVKMLMGAMFVVGALMSLYIPFIPFVSWMGGLIQYVTIFFEGLVAAPIWAFSHLDADGEGMGQRAERGYIFILNMLFRPFLMILGFVLASGLLVVLGTFQAAMFIPAMANVQGNSLTGAASIVMLLGVFVILNITMIHGLFNLITLIPDQVLGWVGNMGNTQLGKEVEEKASRMFVNIGSSMSGAMRAPKLGKKMANAGKPENKPEL